MKKKIDYKYFLNWNVKPFSIVIDYWDSILVDNYPNDCIGLEIGAREGGLSLYLAERLGIKVICSDLKNPKKSAFPIHKKFTTKKLICYDSQNCLNLSYEENKFDFIIFKSCIGALGSKRKQNIAISEMYRCLKKDGILLFAENGKSSILHRIFRKINKYSDYWYYPSYYEFKSYLNCFSEYKLKSTGFFTVYHRNKFYLNIALFLDKIFSQFIPTKYKYIIYGYAKK